MTLQDIDECDRGHNCDKNAECENSEGSFTCKCRPGFTGDGTFCTMNDPCLGGKHNCKAPHICLPIGGTGNYSLLLIKVQSFILDFKCVCPGGFFPDSVDPTVCIDVDECTMGMHTCSASEECQNNEGGFSCTCPEGQA